LRPDVFFFSIFFSKNFFSYIRQVNKEEKKLSFILLYKKPIDALKILKLKILLEKNKIHTFSFFFKKIIIIIKLYPQKRKKIKNIYLA